MDKKISKQDISKIWRFRVESRTLSKKIYDILEEKYVSSYLSNLSKKSHQIEGNRIRLKEIKNIKLKNEWKEKMRKSHKIIIYLFTLPLYIYFYKGYEYIIKRSTKYIQSRIL